MQCHHINAHSKQQAAEMKAGQGTHSRAGQVPLPTQARDLILRQLVGIGGTDHHVIGVILCQTGPVDQHICVQLHLICV